MSPNDVIKEIPGLAITGARYFMAEGIARRIRRGDSATLGIAGFVVADVLDGVILRAFDADTPTRRVADGVIDHASMVRIAYEVAKKNPDSRAYIGILGVRAMLVGGANLLHLIRTGEVTKGQNNQRFTNLATAALCLAALSGDKKITHAVGLSAVAVSAPTAVPHFRNIGKRNESRIRRL